jgi:hypothetical protein
MKTAGSLIITLVLILVFAMPAAAVEKQGQENINFTMSEVSNTTSKVTDIDYQTRTVTLTDSDGRIRTIKVSHEISNLNKVKKGDTVTVELQESMDVEVLPGPGEPMNISMEGQTSPLPEQKPSITRTIEGTLKTRIEAINYEARTITFKNRKGVLTTYKIGKDAKRFDEVRRGDMLLVDYKQVTVLSVKE